VTATAQAPVVVDRRAWQVLAVSAAGVFVVFLDATVVNIAFPALQADFPDVTRAGLSWVLNAYAVVFGALLVTAGRLGDDRGRKRVFLAGIVVFGVASVLCGLAPSVGLLVAARALQAVGAALLVPASLALLLPAFPAEKRSTAIGVWGAAGALAAASGPSIGALLVEGPGWRWVFYANVPVCVAAVVAGRRVLVESTGPSLRSTPDWPGVVLVTTVLGLLSLGLVQGELWGWSSARVLGAFAVAALLTPVLVRRALRHPDPVLPVRLFQVRAFSAATAGTLLFAAAFFATILGNVLFLTSVWDYSVLRTAVATLPAPLLAAALAPPAGRLADRLGHRVVVVPGALLMAAGTLWFSLRLTTEVSYAADFLPGTLMTGAGIGLAFSALGAAGAASLPPQSFGSGSAVGAAARQIGAVLGVAGLIALLGTPGPGEVVDAFGEGYTAAAVSALACAAVAMLLSRTGAAASRASG
jgi:EmrB/QacA subfamily drug resistance transporter